ncbi:MAG: ESX secretion-associated protein EspG [Mycobacteriaceae bacterium]
MAIVGRSFTVSTVAFDLLWERLGLGAFPVALQLRSHGDTFEERHAMLDVARRQLYENGLLNGTEVYPRLGRWLQALARPEAEVDVRWRDGTTELRSAVVHQGEVTVRVVRSGEELTFTPLTPGSMPSAAVDVLPDASAAASGGQISAPTGQLASAYAAAATSAETGTAALLDLGAPRADATSVARALHTIDSVSQIGAAVTTRGRRFRHPSVVAVLDTGHGRFISTEREAPDHSMWSTVRPATEANVVRAVTELLAQAQADSATGNTGSVLRL